MPGKLFYVCQVYIQDQSRSSNFEKYKMKPLYQLTNKIKIYWFVS